METFNQIWRYCLVSLGGETTVYLELLTVSHQGNGCPFVYVLSSGDIFIAYHNDARMLDKSNSDTVSILPKIPGPAAGTFDTALQEQQ